MSGYEVGDVIDASEVPLNRFEFKENEHTDAAETIRIVEIPDKGKPVAVVEEWGDRSGNQNDLLGGHL
jgi:hypothetical protein